MNDDCSHCRQKPDVSGLLTSGKWALNLSHSTVCLLIHWQLSFPFRWSGNHILVGGLQQSSDPGPPCCQLEIKHRTPFSSHIVQPAVAESSSFAPFIFWSAAQGQLVKMQCIFGVGRLILQHTDLLLLNFVHDLFLLTYCENVQNVMIWKYWNVLLIKNIIQCHFANCVLTSRNMSGSFLKVKL